MAARFCTCKAPATALVEGVLVCEKCGERVRDAHEESRDKAIAATARAVAGIERRLADTPQPNGNGHGPSRGDPSANVPRIALTRTESAQSLGCCLTHFKTEIAPHLRRFMHGSKPVYLVSDLQKYAEENAEPPMIEQLEKGKS